MDTKLKTSDWLMVAGGAVMLIFGMALDWAKVGDVSGNNAFDYFFTGGIAWLLTVAVGIFAVLLAVGAIKPSNTPWPLILLAMAGIATLLMLLRVILGGGEEQGIDLDRDIGMYVALIAAAIALAGAVMNYLATGATFKDLTDRDKLKGSFGR
jgi:hypothetical protein